MLLPHETPALGSLDRPALLALVEPVLLAHGCALVELSFKAERPGWVLRVAIEREGSTHPGGGITVDLCADVSRYLSAALDPTELIEPAYQLEVASPGVERTLRSTEELTRFVGQPVKVMLLKPAADGQRVLRGKLVSVAEDTFEVEADGNLFRVAVADVKQANLQLEFGSAHKSPGKASGRSPAKTSKAAKPSSNKTPHPKSDAKSTQAASSQTDGESQNRGLPAETE